MNYLNIENFIAESITKRKNSLFLSDLSEYKDVLLNKIKNKTVLVIGGAGTIGSAFTKEILNFLPSKIVIVDTNENALTELTRDLRSTKNQFIPKDYTTYPMSFYDSSFYNMFRKNKGFNIIANFAAHKHVRSEKDIYSIQAMLNNNVFQANVFLNLLVEYKPENFFCVSTDKAAKPVNVMGASKKLMEEVIMSYKDLFNVTTARFANVAFSNGSLLDGYINRVTKKQPVSCPDNVKRFFVSPKESGQICLLACMLGKSGEVFFPKLSLKDLVSFKKITISFFKKLGLNVHKCDSEKDAKNFIINFNKKKDYPVYFFKSDTSGEKLYEEFYSEKDIIDSSSFNSLGIIKKQKFLTLNESKSIIDNLKDVVNKTGCSKKDIIKCMSNIIDDFIHQEKGKNLDQKM